MRFIIVDCFASSPFIVVDLNAETMYFDSEEEATEYAEKEMQDGYWKVVDLTGVL